MHSTALKSIRMEFPGILLMVNKTKIGNQFGYEDNGKMVCENFDPPVQHNPDHKESIDHNGS